MTAIFRAGTLAADRIAATRDSLSGNRIAPRAAILLDARDAGMQAYGKRLSAFAEDTGITLLFQQWGSTPEACCRQVSALSEDPTLDAIIPLYPLPVGLSSETVAALIGADRDVDGLHPDNAGRLALGYRGRFPATATAVTAIAEHLAGPLFGRHVVLVGASRVVGRPAAQMLLEREATVTLTHVATRDLAAHTRTAEIIVTAAGRPKLIGAKDIADGAILIDVSINRGPEGLVGDVDLAGVSGKAAIVTHVPDGVGPLTTACLMANIADAALQRRDRRKDLSS
ncbi:bifunctional 5,10-methylenetetrahydrofolate dehydrogenase/5,10-methenyltetrahydrofolate cyclohydrolase [Martelella sp. HB161492]|uniref:bifunctional 5,10-methylenetetrahydrofolate dehydrogenase/5,10-methenyltetrahydrofolate cyclohydrolase n=1 Tax=Martelella sp. HB161492 TaxID=2720726 RepID=UPI00159038B8|nr:bifunctional 5,10-methylenetetrahydrofolate dehydrogenase/5,10-methenyltetrahydrofolate cyclohydrolase [Martelella sp. HB161492]